MEPEIRGKAEELFIRLRGNAVSGDEKPQEPEDKFGLFGRRRKPWPLRGRNGALRSKETATEAPARDRRGRGGDKVVRRPELEHGNEMRAGDSKQPK